MSIMFSDILWSFLGHSLLGAVLAIFALGVAFWLLLAFRIAGAVTRKRAVLLSALLAMPRANAEPALKLRGRAP
jgi:hypothetical protein